MPICKICGVETKNYSGLGIHVKSKHNINIEDYYLKYLGEMNENKCINCGNRTTFLSLTKGFRDLCKRCGSIKKDLNFFIKKEGSYEKGLEKYNQMMTKMQGRYTLEWFQEKYGKEEGLKKYEEFRNKSKQTLQNFKNRYGEEEGERKYWEMIEKKRHNNSKEGYIENYGEEKAEEIISSLSNSLENLQLKYGEEEGRRKYKEMRENARKSSKRSIEYWLDQGYDEEEAQYYLKEHQANGRLDKFQERYGEEEGYVKWLERQEKWQETLNNKSEEEKREINKKRFPGRLMKSGLSNKEMKLREVLGCNLQLYIGGFWFDLWWGNKIIEFNGDFWHCNPSKYNPDYFNECLNIYAKDKWKLDKFKIDTAKNNGYDVLIVWENEYQNNYEETVKKCKRFLYGED